MTVVGTRQKNVVALVLLLFIRQVVAESAARPWFNDGSGFFVAQGKLYDSNGVAFTPYGVNSVHIWLDEKSARRALRKDIGKTGANAVRIVTSGESWTWNSQSATPAGKRQLVEMAIDAGLVPIIELHDGTCFDQIEHPAGGGRMGLRQIVDHWLLPDNVAMLKRYERFLMLNIANEWGPGFDAANRTDFLAGYQDAITRLREAGVKNTLMIDAGGCGQDPRTLLAYLDRLSEIDPQHNIVGSIHLYQYWRSGDRAFPEEVPPYSVETDIPRLAALRTPVVVGEFSWDGAGPTVNYAPRILLQTCAENGLGWIFWAWRDGSEEAWSGVSKRGSHGFASADDLTEAGRFLVYDEAYGFTRVARPATMFSGRLAGRYDRTRGGPVAAP